MKHRCSTCQEEKPTEAFTASWLKKASKVCRDCKAEYNARWYDRNKTKHVADVMRNTDRYRREAREFIARHKSVPCAECGRTFPPECMDFDHVRGEKVADVSLLVAWNFSLRRLLAEIAKCEVVCANCHRIRTVRRRRERRQR